MWMVNAKRGGDEFLPRPFKVLHALLSRVAEGHKGTPVTTFYLLQV